MASRRDRKQLVKKERILLAFHQAATKVLPLTMSKSRCLNSSRVTLDALAEFGIKGVPVSVRALFMNQEWYALAHKAGRMPRDAEEKDRWIAQGGYALGIDTDSEKHENYPGHVIVAVPDFRCLIDSAASQFDRSQHGIDVPEVLMVPLPSRLSVEDFIAGKEQAVFGNATGAWGFYNARPEDKEYEKAAGFQPHEQNTEVKDVIVAFMRKLLTSTPD